MLVCPVNSASVSFGQETQKQHSFMFPSAIIGGVVGGASAKITQLKINPQDVDSFIKTVDDKLPMSGQTRSSFFILKDTLTKTRENAFKKLQELGISKDLTEVSVNDLLSKVVQNNQKTLNGLNEDIKYVQGEADYFKTQKDKAAEYLSKLKIIEEKKGMKTLVEQATDGKILTSRLIDFYESGTKNNPQIKNQIEAISNLVNKYNKQKIIYYPIIGLIVGSIIGSFVTQPTKS